MCFVAYHHARFKLWLIVLTLLNCFSWIPLFLNACLAHLAHLYIMLGLLGPPYYPNICVLHACRMLKVFKSRNLSQLWSFFLLSELEIA